MLMQMEQRLCKFIQSTIREELKVFAQEKSKPISSPKNKAEEKEEKKEPYNDGRKPVTTRTPG